MTVDLYLSTRTTDYTARGYSYHVHENECQREMEKDKTNGWERGEQKHCLPCWLRPTTQLKNIMRLAPLIFLKLSKV